VKNRKGLKISKKRPSEGFDPEGEGRLTVFTRVGSKNQRKFWGKRSGKGEKRREVGRKIKQGREGSPKMISGGERGDQRKGGG